MSYIQDTKELSYVMIIDVTGIELIPGNQGKNCPGNGLHRDPWGQSIECCCDECNYALCCTESHQEEDCFACLDPFCPHAK